MPTFHPFSSSMSESFKHSCANLMLEYGQCLAKLSGRYTLDLAENDAEAKRIAPLLESARRLQTDIVIFLETDKNGKRSQLKRFVCQKGENTRISVPKLSIVSLLAWETVCQNDDAIPLCTIIMACSAADPDHVPPLEYRRFIGAMMAEDEGVLRIVDGRDCTGITPHIGLGKNVLTELMGGESCIPFLIDKKIAELRNTKKSKKGVPAPVKNPSEVTPDLSLAEFVTRIPVYSPQELYDEMGRRGYIGQERARRQVCLGIYRFINRLVKVHLEHVSVNDVPSPGHMMLRGETGTGKSHMLKVLASITGINVLVEDCTKFSETGYWGEDVPNILSRLMKVSNYNLEIAQACSLVALDEIDKLASPKSGWAMVSRDGVQRSLLKLLEGTITDIPALPGEHPFHGKRIGFDTSSILWVGLGAFSGWDTVVGKKSGRLGFSQDRGAAQGEEGAEGDVIASSGGYASFGLMEELMGRFSGGIISLSTLSKPEMTQILRKNTLPRYEKECQLNGIALDIHDEVFSILVDQAMERKTGARGLQASLEDKLTECMFAAYSVKGSKRVRLVASNGRVLGVVGKDIKSEEIPTDTEPEVAILDA